MEKNEDFELQSIEQILSNIYRRILLEEMDTIFDEEVMDLLYLVKDYEKINRFNLYKNYGRYIIRKQREY